MLQRPHRVATVGVVLHVRARRRTRRSSRPARGAARRCRRRRRWPSRSRPGSRSRRRARGRAAQSIGCRSAARRRRGRERPPDLGPRRRVAERDVLPPPREHRRRRACGRLRRAGAPARRRSAASAAHAVGAAVAHRACSRVGSERTSTPGASRRVQSSNGRVEICGTTRAPAALRVDGLVDDVAPAAGIGPRVEHRADQHRTPARAGEPQVPLEVFLAHGAVRGEQRGRRHREDAGTAALAEHRRDREQLVVAAHLAGQPGARGPDVVGDLIGAEPDRAELERAQRPAPAIRAISSGVATRSCAACGAHHRGPDRDVARVGREVRQRRGPCRDGRSTRRASTSPTARPRRARRVESPRPTLITSIT